MCQSPKAYTCGNASIKPDKTWWKPPAELKEPPINPTANHTHSFVNPYGYHPATTSEQEGITPMRYETNTCIAPSAIASITVPSDEAKKIDYLNSRACQIQRDLRDKFYSMFNMNGPSQPRYYKELIKAIKDGEYEIDEKAAKRADETWEGTDGGEEGYYDYNVFYGIDFTGFPKPDYKGYEAAKRELVDEHQKVKDIIAIMDAEEALKAVQDFEKFVPSNAPTVQ